MASLLFLFLNFQILSSLSLASAVDLAAVKEACQPPAKMDEQLEYCSENTVAVNAAKECKQALKRMWDNAPKELGAAFGSLFKKNDGRQRLNFHDSHTDYQTTLKKLDDLIRLTQDKTDLIAEYPRVMVDYPGAANDPELSAPCYNDKVAEIQKIVGEMDDMILQGMAAYDQAAGLGESAKQRREGIDASTSNTVVHGGSSEPIPVSRSASGKSPRHNSDVTGIRTQSERAKEKEILNSFPKRDQLTP